MKNFKARYGAWALVTGGTSGIGAALAMQLASVGMNLVLVARNAKGLEHQAQQIQAKYSVQVRSIAADLTQAAGLASVLSATQDLEIGILVPCAALENRGYFVRNSLDDDLAILQMDVTAPMVMTKHYGAQMAERGRGAIVLVSSLSGWMPQPYMAHYGACKAYILALGAALHHEMKDHGVDVSVLSPGPTDTPMAKATGIDFAAMGMSIMSPEAVAAIGLAGLGKRPDAVPGPRNQFMVFMVTRLLSRRFVGKLFKTMMGRALQIGPHSS